MSFEDKKFLKIADESAIKKDGDYEIRLPFHDIVMPNDKLVAELQAMTLRRKRLRNEAFYSDYTMFDKGRAEKVPDDELSRCNGRVYTPPQGLSQEKE